MIIKPTIFSSYTESPTVVLPRCLVVLPGSVGRSDFVPIDDYESLLKVFDYHYIDESKIDANYDHTLRRSLQYMLNSGMKLLVATGAKGDCSSIRFYATGTSLGHSNISSIDVELPKSVMDYITANGWYSDPDALQFPSDDPSASTLVHRLQLTFENGKSVAEYPDGARKNIILPMRYMDDTGLSYDGNWYIHLNNHQLLNADNMYEIWTDEGNTVYTFDYLGKSVSEIKQQVNLLNQYLESSREWYVNNGAGHPLTDASRVRAFYDDSTNSILFVNDYLCRVSSFSDPYNDLITDYSASGTVIQASTYLGALLDVRTSVKGERSGTVQLLPQDGSIRVIVLTDAMREFIVTDSDEQYSITDSDITVTYYGGTYEQNGEMHRKFDLLHKLAEDSINTQYLLVGGTNIPADTDSIRLKYDEYFKVGRFSDSPEDWLPIYSIFTCDNDLQLVKYIDTLIRASEFKNTYIISNYEPAESWVSKTPEGELKFEPSYSAESQLAEYMGNIVWSYPLLVELTNHSKILLQAYLAVLINDDNYSTRTDYIESKSYLDLVKLLTNEYLKYTLSGLNCPTYIDTLVPYSIINSIKLNINEDSAKLIEASVSTYIKAKLEPTIVYNLSGSLGCSEVELRSKVEKLLPQCYVSQLITNVTLDDIQTQGRNAVVNLTISRWSIFNAEEIILNIYIKL